MMPISSNHYQYPTKGLNPKSDFAGFGTVCMSIVK